MPTGVPQAKVIHNFGRADTVDRDGLARLVEMELYGSGTARRTG